MVDERVGLIGPAVLVLDGPAVPVPGMVVFIDIVEERVGLIGPAVPVPDMVLFDDIVDVRVRVIGPAVPVDVRVRVTGPAEPVPLIVLLLPVGNGAEDDRDGPIGPA